MSTDRLLTHYERTADAPEAIMRMRHFILDLAVRGKLVPQDSRDEPAGELLLRIADEKERLGKEARPKRRDAVENLTNTWTTMPVPLGWVISNLESLCTSVTDGDHLPPPQSKIGVPFLVIGNVRNRYIDFTETRYVPQDYYDALDPIRRPRRGDLLYTLVGSYGIPVVVREDRPFCIQRHIGVLRPSTHIDVYYFELAMASRFVFEQAAACATGIAQKTVSLGGLRKLVLPLPPFAEQRRIVAKVNELMNVCDSLEAARTRREEVRTRYASAIFDRVARVDPDSNNQDVFGALENLPALTARVDLVQQLRLAILNLGVLGRLERQEAGDEPAALLEERIQRDRKCKRRVLQLDWDGRNTPLPGIPANWRWTSIDRVSADADNAITDGPFGASLKTEHYIDSPGYRVIRLQNISPGTFRDEHRAYIDKGRFESLQKHSVLAGDLIVAGLVDPRIRCCQAPEDIGPAIVKADCYRFAVHPDISARYLLHYLNSPLAQTFAEVHHHGMTLTRIGLGNFRKIPVPLPPAAEQSRIVSRIDELLSLIAALENNLAVEKELRTRLLAALLNEAIQSLDSGSSQNDGDNAVRAAM